MSGAAPLRTPCRMLGFIVLAVIALLLGTLGSAPRRGHAGERPMHTASYRTRDGRADYRFGFTEWSDGTWRVYILSQPSYGRQSASAYATHRLSDGGPHYYICWTGALHSLEQAKHVASLWADRTQQYIRTGSF